MMTTVAERRPSWYGIGTNVDGCHNDLEAILAKAGLNYTVTSRPVTVDGIGVMPNYKAIVREDNGRVYQIAKQSYEICQNEQAFSLINQLDEEVQVRQAGETDSGLIYLIAQMSEQNVLGDTFTPHIIFQNSHTSEYGLRMAICPLRIVCQNQFSTAFGSARNTQTIKHTSSIHSQIEAANAVLTDVAAYMSNFTKEADRLASTKLPVEPALEALFPMPDQLAATSRSIENVTEKRERFMEIYNNDDNSNFRGTSWGFINAATDYITHRPIRNNGEESHFMSTTINPELLKRATAIIYN